MAVFVDVFVGVFVLDGVGVAVNIVTIMIGDIVDVGLFVLEGVAVSVALRYGCVPVWVKLSSVWLAVIC